MFLFSTTPTYLNYDSNGVMVDASNELDILEHRLMAIESLFGALTLDQYIPYRVTGVDNSNLSAVTTELQVRRDSLLQAVTGSGVSDYSDAEARFKDIGIMQQATDMRISDLEQLKQALINGTTANISVSGVNPNDMASIDAELNIAVAYKNFLETSAEVWSQVYELQAGTSINSNTDNNDQNNEVIQNIEVITQSGELRVEMNDLIRLFSVLASFESEESLEARMSAIKGELEYELEQIGSISSSLEPEAKYFEKYKTSMDTIQTLRTEFRSVSLELSFTKLNEENKHYIGRYMSSLSSELSSTY